MCRQQKWTQNWRCLHLNFSQSLLSNCISTEFVIVSQYYTPPDKLKLVQFFVSSIISISVFGVLLYFRFRRRFRYFASRYTYLLTHPLPGQTITRMVEHILSQSTWYPPRQPTKISCIIYDKTFIQLSSLRMRIRINVSRTKETTFKICANIMMMHCQLAYRKKIS